jgi:hypothetical protein
VWVLVLVLAVLAGAVLAGAVLVLVLVLRAWVLEPPACISIIGMMLSDALAICKERTVPPSLTVPLVAPAAN